MNSIFNVAAFILQKLGKTTTMKLQKLAYYCQAWSLAWDGLPLFKEDFQAWANGPVCVELFDKYKGLFEVDEHFFGDYFTDCFNDTEIETMEAVLDDLGSKSPQWLSDLSHSERPWRDARKGYDIGECCDVVIDKVVMQDYYSGLSADKT